MRMTSRHTDGHTDKNTHAGNALHPIVLAYSLPQEMEIEATDDIMRQSGSGGGESYFGTPLPRLVASRVGWLVRFFYFSLYHSE